MIFLKGNLGGGFCDSVLDHIMAQGVHTIQEDGFVHFHSFLFRDVFRDFLWVRLCDVVVSLSCSRITAGLWEVCFAGMVLPTDPDQVSYHGCWWILSPMYQDIRGWIMPGKCFPPKSQTKFSQNRSDKFLLF